MEEFSHREFRSAKSSTNAVVTTASPAKPAFNFSPISPLLNKSGSLCRESINQQSRNPRRCSNVAHRKRKNLTRAQNELAEHHFHFGDRVCCGVFGSARWCRA